jgi:hypothetical protein
MVNFFQFFKHLFYFNPRILNAIKYNQKPNVIILATNPILDHVYDFFFSIAIKPNPSAIGGPNNIRNPPRIPSIEPHPKPGQRNICSTVIIQGDKASQKEVFPKPLDFIMLNSFNKL